MTTSAPAWPSAIATVLPMPELAPVASAFCPARILRISQLGMTTDGRFSCSTFLPISVVLALGLPVLAASRLQSLGNRTGPAGLVRGADTAAIVAMEGIRRTAGGCGSADRSAASSSTVICHHQPIGRTTSANSPTRVTNDLRRVPVATGFVVIFQQRYGFVRAWSSAGSQRAVQIVRRANQADMVGEAEHPLENQSRLLAPRPFVAAGPGQCLDQPKRTDVEGALLSG